MYSNFNSTEFLDASPSLRVYCLPFPQWRYNHATSASGLEFDFDSGLSTTMTRKRLAEATFLFPSVTWTVLWWDLREWLWYNRTPTLLITSFVIREDLGDSNLMMCEGNLSKFYLFPLADVTFFTNANWEKLAHGGNGHLRWPVSRKVKRLDGHHIGCRRFFQDGLGFRDHGGHRFI